MENKELATNKKRGRWDDDDSDESPKKSKKPVKTVGIKPVSVINTPVVSVGTNNDLYKVDDFYAKNPLPEAPEYEEKDGNGTVIGRDAVLIHSCCNVNKYKKLAHLSEGSYGVVYKALNTETNEVVALKRIKFNNAVVMQEAFPVTALREINILQDLHHPNILNVQEMVIGDSLNDVYMVMDYVPNELGHILHTAKEDFSMKVVKTWLHQVLSGIAYMHSKWYFHRDLKSSNLLYKDGEIKICDFGMARRFSDPLGKYTQHVVTLLYRAPELLLNPQEDMHYKSAESILYDSKVDMWSVGCLFYEFFSRETIVQCKEGESEYDILIKLFKILGYPGDEYLLLKKSPYATAFKHCKKYYNVLRDQIPMTPLIGNRYLTDLGMDLLLRLLAWEPSQRLSAEEALNHPYFKESPGLLKKEDMPLFEVKG